MTAPAGVPRLLAGYHTTGQAADLRDHLSQYGPPPFPELGARATVQGRGSLVSSRRRA